MQAPGVLTDPFCEIAPGLIQLFSLDADAGVYRELEMIDSRSRQSLGELLDDGVD